MELNKIYQGDALKLMSNLPDKSVDVLITDPPYGMSFQSNFRNDKHKKITNDDDLRWLPVFVFHAYRLLKDDRQLYVFCGKQTIEVFIKEFKKWFSLKNILVWKKNNTGMGDLEGSYADRTEFILFLSKGKSDVRGRRDDNILSFDRTGNELHPTQKPEDLMRFLIKKSSDEDDVILDPFMGSGTTAIACQQLGRQFIGFELDDGYCASAEKRLAQKTLLGV